MVRLTAQLINMSAQKHNPVRDWELDLRGYRIPVIENLGATLDQFDTIDFTDNDIRKIDKFPLLKRLKHVMLSNNRIVRISEDLQENLPSLETLLLTNNGLKELADIDPLGSVTTLKYLSLLGNPVTTRKNYRLYIIHKIPSLRVLDFSRIKLKEREAAAKMFKKKKSQSQQQQQQQTTIHNGGDSEKTFTPGENLQVLPRVAATGPTKQEAEAIRKAIMGAKSLEEYEKIHQMLQSGQIPGKADGQSKSTGQKDPEKKAEEEEEDEEEEEEEEEEMEAERKDEDDNDGNEAAGYQEEDSNEDNDDMEED